MMHLRLSFYHICMLMIFTEYYCLLDFSLITSFYPFLFNLTFLSFVFFSYKHINEKNYKAYSFENLSSSMFLALNFLSTLKQNGIWLCTTITQNSQMPWKIFIHSMHCKLCIMYINVSHSSNWIDIDNK